MEAAVLGLAQDCNSLRIKLPQVGTRWLVHTVGIRAPEHSKERKPTGRVQPLVDSDQSAPSFERLRQRQRQARERDLHLPRTCEAAIWGLRVWGRGSWLWLKGEVRGDEGLEEQGGVSWGCGGGLWGVGRWRKDAAQDTGASASAGWAGTPSLVAKHVA